MRQPVPVLPRSDEALLALAGVAPLPPPAEGLFRDGGWLRRVSSENVLLFGGGRALLLEVAHPLVAAGVADHSAFREDPLGRLKRTLEAVSALTFGDRTRALAAARAVERGHQHVVGTLPEAVGRHPAGAPYHGRQPELVRWVWATLVDTAVVVYECFVAPLPPDACAAYYADQCAIARLLGVPPDEVPPSWEAFRAYMAGMLEGDALCVGRQGAEIAQAVLRSEAIGTGGGMLRLMTAALLPPRLRDAFGLRWDEARRQRFEALRASVRSLRRPSDAPAAP